MSLILRELLLNHSTFFHLSIILQNWSSHSIYIAIELIFVSSLYSYVELQKRESLIKETPESSLASSALGGHSEKAFYEPGSGPSPYTDSASTSILDSTPLELRNKCVLFISHSVYGICCGSLNGPRHAVPHVFSCWGPGGGNSARVACGTLTAEDKSKRTDLSS